MATKFPPHIRIMRDGAQLRASERPRITCPADVVRVMAHLVNEEQEVFVGLWLDTRSRVLAQTEITRGLLDAAMVHPREVFRHAIAAGCSGVILVHNHPSGDPTPSAEDRAVTRQLVAAGQLLDIPVYDHVIIAGDRHVSFTQAGILG